MIPYTLPTSTNTNRCGTPPGANEPERGNPGGGGSNSMVMFYSSPLLSTGTYTLKYGGAISGGSSFHNYSTDATYSGGSSKTFTINSSMVTTVQ